MSPQKGMVPAWPSPYWPSHVMMPIPISHGGSDTPGSRNAVAVDPVEDRRGVPVPGQAVADARGSGRVDQAGAGRGDERVDPQDVRQPREPAQGRDGGERPREDLRVVDLLEPVP